MRSSILLKTKEHLGTPDWSCQGGEAAIFGEERECHSLCAPTKLGRPGCQESVLEDRVAGRGSKGRLPERAQGRWGGRVCA